MKGTQWFAFQGWRGSHRCGYSGCELHGVWYKDISGINLVTAVDSDINRAQKAAKRFGAHSFTDDWRKALSNPAVDIVDMNVPPNLNKIIAIAAAEVGKHIQYAEVKRAVEANMIGRLHAGSAIRWLGEPYFPFLSTWNKWYGSRGLGGGVTFSIQIHELDFLKTLFGKVREVRSVSRNFTRREFGIDDFSATTLLFEDGRTALAEASRVSPSPFTQQLDLFGEEGFLSLRTGGTLTSIGASKDAPAVTAYFKDGTSRALPTSDMNGYHAEIKHFVSCVLGDRMPLLDPGESHETLRITLAALESADTSKPVDVNSY